MRLSFRLRQLGNPFVGLVVRIDHVCTQQVMHNIEAVGLHKDTCVAWKTEARYHHL